MSLYDTIRCAWHDPGYLLEEYDGEIGGLAVTVLIIVWASL